MLLRAHKRRHAGNGDGGGPALSGTNGTGRSAPADPPAHSDGGGGGGVHLTALLDALGLGAFARLDLPAPPDGLGLTAAADPCSDHIIVSLGGVSVLASPADLAAALSLPLGVAALPAPVFSSAGAIGAVRAFVLDRLLLGGTGVLPEGTAAALQLVEDGKAYAVDWGWFVWAFLMSDVLVGEPRRCGRYLFRLMRCKRPDLFSEVDGRFLGKRRKVLILQQDEKSLHGNGIYDQPRAAEAEVEEKSVSGPSKKSGGVKDQQHTIGTEDQEDGSHCNGNAAPSLPSFYASRQQVLAHLSNMENALLDKERTLSRTLAEIRRMKEEEEEKDNEIAYIVKEIEEELQARHTKINQLEHDRMLMRDILHGCKEMLQDSSAAFLEYRKAMCEGSGVSSLDVVANEKNQLRFMQQQWQARERIVDGFQKPMLLKVTACAKKIAVLLPKLTGLNNEVQRLKGSRSIPDLNVGPHL
ncbi:uncharacterized protein [Lolium perenne]|uniref:uncharacterized protein n=1 Tax=Lolium perenne TaxID=4522 RepID=UPI0021EA6D43|nr:uncharacterized protein LOC127343927 [Lolium perenne]